MHHHVHPVEIFHWLATLGSPVVIATALLLILPTPDKFAENNLMKEPPRWYVILYNWVRYIAHLNPNAGWQPLRGGNGAPLSASNGPASRGSVTEGSKP